MRRARRLRAIVARMWRRVMLIVTFPLLCFAWFGVRTVDQTVPPPPDVFGGSEFDELHGRHEMFRECGNRRIGIAFERGPHDRRVLGLDIAGFLGVAPDREPSIALALLVQHVAKPEQPWRAAGVHQRAMEDPVPHHPFLIVMGRIVGIGVGNGAERRERLLHRRQAMPRRRARSSGAAPAPRYRPGFASRR